MSFSREALGSIIAGGGKEGLQGIQKSTRPVPSPPSRASAAMDGLCAAVLRNNEVTLSAIEPPYGADPAGTTGSVVIGWPARGSTGRPYIRMPAWRCSTGVKEV